MNKIALVALLLLAPAAWSYETTKKEIDKFQLWNNCRPMRLVIAMDDSDAARIGLTRKDIESAVRSRLRVARLYDEDADNALYIELIVTEHAFGISWRYYKEVKDKYSTYSLAPTWQRGFAGSHGEGGGSFILSDTPKRVDFFIDEYLRVNESGCSK
ncbi:MAG: hypothetical protein OXD29_00580 [Roseovarius sp.]|nr:hypothetical protein [Roseovarius sp.]